MIHEGDKDRVKQQNKWNESKATTAAVWCDDDGRGTTGFNILLHTPLITLTFSLCVC